MAVFPLKCVSMEKRVLEESSVLLLKGVQVYYKVYF